MKTKIFIVSFLMINAIALAQNLTSGIYLSANDFKNHKLASTPVEGKKYKIRVNEVFSGSRLCVIIGDTQVKCYKDSIFGYRDVKHRDFRFKKGDDRKYQILEYKDLVIYSADVPVFSSSGKTFELISTFYFSASLDSEIYPLSVIYLKKAFPDNQKFHDLLDVEFGTQKEISLYDETNRMYRVNYLLNKSLQK